MKKFLLLLLISTCAYGMKPIRVSKSAGNTPITSPISSPIIHPRVLAIRDSEEKKDEELNIHIITPRFKYLDSHIKHLDSHVIDIVASPETPEKVKIERIKAHVMEVKAHTEEVKAISKKKIAAMVLAGSVVSAALTAAVTLTVHFTSCK